MSDDKPSDTKGYAAAESAKAAASSSSLDLRWHTPSCTSESWTHTEVKFEVENGIAYVTLNRPDKQNAISTSMHSALRDVVTELHSRKDDIRVVILQAEGRYFCSGGDITEQQAVPDMPEGSSAFEAVEDMKRRAETVTGAKLSPGGVVTLLNLKFFQAWRALPQFTVGVAQGSAIGMGFAFLCVCDMIVMQKGASFICPEAKMATIASITPCIVSKVGQHKAKRLLCTAEQLNVDKAKEMGIADEIVERGGAPDIIKTICSRLSACAPYAVAGHKNLIQGVLGEGALTDEAIFVTVVAHEESKSINAASEKPWTSTPLVPR